MPRISQKVNNENEQKKATSAEASASAPQMVPPSRSHPAGDALGHKGQHLLETEGDGSNNGKLVLTCKFPYLTIKEYDNLPKKHRKAG